MFPTYDESVEEVEEVRANNSVETGAAQNDSVVCDGQGVIDENISENFDGDVSERVKFD